MDKKILILEDDTVLRQIIKERLISLDMQSVRRQNAPGTYSLRSKLHSRMLSWLTVPDLSAHCRKKFISSEVTGKKRGGSFPTPATGFYTPDPVTRPGFTARVVQIRRIVPAAAITAAIMNPALYPINVQTKPIMTLDTRSPTPFMAASAP